MHTYKYNHLSDLSVSGWVGDCIKPMSLSPRATASQSVDPSTMQQNFDVNTQNNESSIVSNAQKIFGSSALPTSFGKFDNFYTSLRDSEIEQRKQQTESMERMRGYRGDGNCVGVRRRRKNFRDNNWQHIDAPSGSSELNGEFESEDDDVGDDESGSEAFGVDISVTKELFSGQQKSTEIMDNSSALIMCPTPRDDPPSDKTDDGFATSTSSNSSVTDDASSISSSTSNVQFCEGKDSGDGSFPGKQVDIEKECTLERDVPPPDRADDNSAISFEIVEAHESGADDMDTCIVEKECSLECDVPQSDETDDHSAIAFVNEVLASKTHPIFPQTGLEDAFMEISIATPEPNNRTQSALQEEARHLPMPTPSPIKAQLSHHEESAGTADPVECRLGAICDSPTSMELQPTAPSDEMTHMTPSKSTEEKSKPIVLTPSPTMSHEHQESVEFIHEAICGNPMPVDMSVHFESIAQSSDATHKETSKGIEEESKPPAPTASPIMPQPSHQDSAEFSYDSPMLVEKVLTSLTHNPSKSSEENSKPVAPTPSPIMLQDLRDEESIDNEECGHDKEWEGAMSTEIHPLSPMMTHPSHGNEPTAHAECDLDDIFESAILIDEMHSISPIVPQPSEHKGTAPSAECSRGAISEEAYVHSNPTVTHRTPSKTSFGKAKPTPSSSKRKSQKGMKLTSPPKRQKLDEVLKKLGITPTKTWGTGIQLYNGRSVQRISTMKKCKSKFCQWEPQSHSSRAACERCWTLASTKEREEFIANGRHLRIELARGGCPSSCTLFAHKDGKSLEEAIRLCRRCFGDLHHVGMRG